jgi:hypothetical protein
VLERRRRQQAKNKQKYFDYDWLKHRKTPLKKEHKTEACFKPSVSFSFCCILNTGFLCDTRIGGTQGLPLVLVVNALIDIYSVAAGHEVDRRSDFRT